MEWLKIKTSTELVRVRTDEIVYVCADGNYSDLMLINGHSRKMTFQLHYFDDIFKQLHNNSFVRVGRSLIVNKRYVFVINLTEQKLLFTGKNLNTDIKPIKVSREALKQLMELLAEEKGGEHVD
ncbi:MAG: LytTR family transcriptional regulator DNA-binding domain-containing protein [Bacteroidaceae bacterium]|nr:LytTR family transcriptional regulator DNA-binding domain-containing protein [Bacteroidaceae bacterium]